MNLVMYVKSNGVKLLIDCDANVQQRGKIIERESFEKLIPDWTFDCAPFPQSIVLMI